MIDEYRYLWDGSAPEPWGLLHVNANRTEETPRYLVVNLKTKQALAIREGELAKQVKDEMLKHGVSVVSVGNGF